MEEIDWCDIRGHAKIWTLAEALNVTKKLLVWHCKLVRRCRTSERMHAPLNARACTAWHSQRCTFPVHELDHVYRFCRPRTVHKLPLHKSRTWIEAARNSWNIAHEPQLLYTTLYCFFSTCICSVKSFVRSWQTRHTSCFNRKAFLSAQECHSTFSVMSKCSWRTKICQGFSIDKYNGFFICDEQFFWTVFF